MGLFGSNKKTFVATHVDRVIDDDHMPDSILEGMGRDLKEGTEQLVEQVMESLVGNIGIKAGRMYNYANRGYIYGRPSGELHSSFAGKEATEAVLQAQTGGPVNIQYYHFGPMNLLHFGWQRLVENFGYNQVTNEITGLSTAGKPVYLQNMRAIVTNATLDELANGSLDQWGTPPNAGFSPDRKAQTKDAGNLLQTMAYAVDPAAAADYILVNTCWEEAGEVKFGTFNMSISGFDMDLDTHQVKYTTAAGTIRYWSYVANTGVYPEIDAIFNKGYETAGHFFPWTYFRFDKKSEGENKQSQGYLQSKKMATILNLDYDGMLDGIHENPDINDIEQAMMIMAVPIKGEREIEKRYLFDFFDGLYESQKAEPEQYVNTQTYPSSFKIISKIRSAVNRSSLVIQDKRFKMTMNWESMVRRRVAGSIGAIGTHTVDINPNDTTVNLPSLSGDPLPVVFSDKSHRFRHQVAPGVYEEIVVYALKLTYYIFEGYNTVGDGDSDILLVPVDISIARGYTLAEREELYACSLHYLINSRVTIKLKWYQTGIFRAIVIIVMIVVTIITQGATIKGLLAAVAAGTVTWSVLAMMLVQWMIKQLVYMILLRLFVQVVGIKVAFLVAIVAAIAGTNYAVEAGVAGSPTATQLLGISTGLTKAINKEVKEEFEDLADQRSEFDKYVEEQTKLLETAQDLLTPTNRLAPLVIFGEKPDDFYRRTVHSGNIAVLGQDAISSFVDVALTLPTKISDMI